MLLTSYCAFLAGYHRSLARMYLARARYDSAAGNAMRADYIKWARAFHRLYVGYLRVAKQGLPPSRQETQRASVVVIPASPREIHNPRP